MANTSRICFMVIAAWLVKSVDPLNVLYEQSGREKDNRRSSGLDVEYQNATRS